MTGADEVRNGTTDGGAGGGVRGGAEGGFGGHGAADGAADGAAGGAAGDARVVAYLLELVLDVLGPVHAVEPLLRTLRERLEAAGELFARQVGAHVSQEFGTLTCTVRAVVDSADLLAATETALRGVRPLIAATLVDQDVVTVRETALHVRVL